MDIVVGLIILAVIVAAACYTARCPARTDKRNLPPEIQRELDPFGARR